MKIKNYLFYIIKILNISMTTFALCFCLSIGYIFFCNLIKMPVPTLGPLKLYVVLSDSMVPYMKTNDGIIIAKTKADKLKVGDVITFTSFESNTTITHRISKITKADDSYEFNTWGDNNNTEDSFVTPENRIIGRVVTRIAGFGLMIENIQKNPALIVLPVFLFIVLQVALTFLQDKLKPMKKEKSKKIYNGKIDRPKVQKYYVTEQGEVERSDIDEIEFF